MSDEHDKIWNDAVIYTLIECIVSILKGYSDEDIDKILKNAKIIAKQKSS